MTFFTGRCFTDVPKKNLLKSFFSAANKHKNGSRCIILITESCFSFIYRVQCLTKFVCALETRKGHKQLRANVLARPGNITKAS